MLSSIGKTLGYCLILLLTFLLKLSLAIVKLSLDYFSTNTDCAHGTLDQQVFIT